MKLLKIDRKNGLLVVVPETFDDLWHLERIIEPHDIVSGGSTRKVKGKEIGMQATKETIYVEIEAEKIEFHKPTGQLRVLGIVVSGKPEEYVELKSHHALEIELNKKVGIKKRQLGQYEIDRVQKAVHASRHGKILLVAMDDEGASLAFLKEFELQKSGTIHSGRSGKQFAEDESVKAKYFSEVLKSIQESRAEKIVVAGPGFARDDFKKFLEQRGISTQNYVFGAINSTGITGLNEMLGSNLLIKAVREMQIIEETRLIERVFEAIGRDFGLVEYGIEGVKKAVQFGAVQQLIVADKFFLENRKNIEDLMAFAEKMKGMVHIVNAEHAAGKKLMGIGGIAALLRFRIE